MRLLLTSQTEDSCAVSTTSLASLFSKLRSNVLDANCKPQSISVLTRACCAAASFLTDSNADVYRPMLAKYGDDSDVCTFLIFAMSKMTFFLPHVFVAILFILRCSLICRRRTCPKSAFSGACLELISSGTTSKDIEFVPNSPNILFEQIGVERIIRELPDRMHRAPLLDIQKNVVTALCEALRHNDSPSLLSDVTVTITANSDRMCDIVRDQLQPAISSVNRLLSSTSAGLTQAFKAMARSLSVSIDQNFIDDPAAALLELLPLCGSAEMVAAAFNVMHAIQV